VRKALEDTLQASSRSFNGVETARARGSKSKVALIRRQEREEAMLCKKRSGGTEGEGAGAFAVVMRVLQR
jgi:hypothetical protein